MSMWIKSTGIWVTYILMNSQAFAGTLGAGLYIGPSQEALLFHKDSSQTVVKKCANHTAPNKRGDCNLRQGTNVVQVPLDKLKDQLKLSAEFIKIKAGIFKMGSPLHEENRGSDEKQHKVTLTQNFQIQTTEVTQLQYFLIMGYNPSVFKNQDNCADEYIEINGTSLCPNNPVEKVSWDDVKDFLRKVNKSNDGYIYRLPTEAEWELAARGGSHTAYSFGNNSNQLDQYAWYYDNSEDQTHAVATKLANNYGLYDVHGNVWEWVEDIYGNYSSGSVTNPRGASSGPLRVFRGGGWDSDAYSLRSAIRNYWWPYGPNSDVGFRLVRTPK